MTFEVWVDDRQTGICAVEVRPGFQAPSLTFTYLDDWLADDRAFAISPDLPLQRGPHTPPPHRTTFVAFDDAAPDRWGRNLLDAGMRRAARDRREKFRQPSEIDLLLAVSDETRQGALRFRQKGVFLDPAHERAGIRDLARLADAANRFAENGEVDEGVKELIGVGSSPGGAQPKAWVRDEEGTMHLAKFPRTSDVYDISAWELAAIRMQAKAGIAVQPSQTVPLGHDHSVFLTRRFDREGVRRLPYMSFRTAFRIAEHELVDYATLASKVAGISSSPDADAAELFSRAAFTAMVNNIDDHMRNHGLLRVGAGWRLSPSFDVNPSRLDSAATPLTPEDDPADRDIGLLVEHAHVFRLTRDQAVQRIQAVDAAVSGWRDEAVGAGVAPDALDFMTHAFEGENRARTAALAVSGPTVIDMASALPPAASGDVWVKPHVRRGRRIEGHFRRR